MGSKVMMSSGHPFVLALMDALGLPKETMSFELRCKVGEPVTVSCTYLPRAGCTDGFDPKPQLAQYKLVPAHAVALPDPVDVFADEESASRDA